MKSLFEKVFGLAWTQGLAPRPLVLAAIVALVGSAAAGVPFFEIWPGPDNPALDRRGSPGVRRDGARLELTGTLPFAARRTDPGREGHRVSFGDAPPEENPPPASWEHYAPDGVILHSPGKGTTNLAPAEFERNARLGFFVLTFVQNLLIATVFFFVVAALLRFKRVEVPAFGALHTLARCLIPACAYFAVLVALGTRLAATLAAVAFVLVLAMNALLFVMGAKPAATEAAFDV